MSKSPADFLRTLDQQATPGPWKWNASLECIPGVCEFYIGSAPRDGKIVVTLRNLLPALADVIAAVEKNISQGKIDGTYTAYHRLVAEIEKVQK